MRISDWSSDVCSSDLARRHAEIGERGRVERLLLRLHDVRQFQIARLVEAQIGRDDRRQIDFDGFEAGVDFARHRRLVAVDLDLRGRSEEHTSELQSLMRISYAVFCLKKKN